MTRTLAAWVFAAGLLSQSGQTPTFRARADLVQIDVVVVDKAGAPVKGLERSAFVLRDRGKEQAIASFDEVSHDAERARASAALPKGAKRDTADNQDAQSGRLVVLVIDDLHIYRGRTDRARDIARSVLTDLGPQSSMAVLFTSGDHSTMLSTDASVLGAAIETLKGRQSWRRPHPAQDGQAPPRIGADMDPLAALDQLSLAGKVSAQDFFDNMSQYKTLQDAARMLGGDDARRKAFVLISEGIGKDLHGLFGAMAPAGDVPQGGLAYAAGDVAALNIVQPSTYHDFALIDMMDAMRRSNVATYAIDPRGKVGSADLLRECSPAPSVPDPCSEGLSDFESPVRQAQSGLQIVSEASGGFAVTDTDDFTGGLAKIVDDLDHYYLLGFYPSDQKGRSYRPLDVRVPGHPEWTLRFRRGYMPEGSVPPPKNATAMTALSAGVLPKGELPLRLGAIPLPGAVGSTRVALAIEVAAPVRELRDADGKLRDTLKYEVLVVNEKKARVRSLGGLEGKLTLSPAQGGEAPPTVSYQVGELVEIPPGRYELRVSATSERLRKGGSVYLDIDVPDLRSPPVALGGLAIAYADGARVPVAPPPLRRPASPLPFAPSLDRVFTASDSLRVYAEGVCRNNGASATLEVIGAAGTRVLSVVPTVSPGDPLRVSAVVPLRGLPPGPYTLRVALTDGSHTAAKDVGFAVR